MRLTSNEIFYLNELSSASGAVGRDCVVSDKVITFLVRKEDLGKAIGKNASAVKKLRQKLKKNIEILEYVGNAEGFIKKALYNIEIKEVNVAERNGKKHAIVSMDRENKEKVLRNSTRIKRIKLLAKRNYAIENIKIR